LKIFVFFGLQVCLLQQKVIIESFFNVKQILWTSEWEADSEM